MVFVYAEIHFSTKVLLISEYIYTSQTQRLISEMILTASCEL